MNLSDDFKAKWEHIISGVDEKTAVPVECIDKVIIKCRDRKRRTVNFKLLQRQGLDLDDIENVLTKNLMDLGDDVVDMHFVLNIEAVAELVQPETNRLLRDL